MSRVLKIAVAQIDTTVGDFAGNAQKIIAAGRRSEQEEADLTLFPELAVCGYPPKDLLHRSPFLKAPDQAPRRVVEASGSALWLFGSLDRNRARAGRNVFNT